MGSNESHDRWTALESEHGYICARLTLVSTEDGGRMTPLMSGYKSCWAFDPAKHADWHDGPLTLEDGADATLAPGESARIRIHPLFPDYWPAVEVGWQLRMHEGSRCLGTAEVLGVVPPSA